MNINHEFMGKVKLHKPVNYDTKYRSYLGNYIASALLYHRQVMVLIFDLSFFSKQIVLPESLRLKITYAFGGYMLHVN